MTGSGKTFTIANVIQQVQRPTLVLAHNKTLAAQLYGEFKTFFPKNSVEYFVSYYDYYQPEAYVPSSDTFIEKDASINEHIEQMRLSATKALSGTAGLHHRGDRVGHLRTWATRTHISAWSCTCRAATSSEQRKLLRRLADMQYTRNEIDLHQGTYRVRGDVIDIFPGGIRARSGARRTVRRSDRDVELLRPAHRRGHAQGAAAHGLSLDALRHTEGSRGHFGGRTRFARNCARDCSDLHGASKLVEAQRLQQRTMFDLEMMGEVGYCAGIENYSRYLSGRGAGRAAAVPVRLPAEERAMLVIDESHQTIPQLGAMYKGDRSRKETLVEYGFRLPSALDNRPLRFEEFEHLARRRPSYVSATPSAYEKKMSGQVVEQVVRPTGLIDPVVEIRPVRAQVDDLLSEIRLRAQVGERVLVTTLTKRMAEDLTEYLA